MAVAVAVDLQLRERLCRAEHGEDGRVQRTVAGPGASLQTHAVLEAGDDEFVEIGRTDRLGEVADLCTIKSKCGRNTRKRGKPSLRTCFARCG